ncbi:hypothetical protein BH24ACT26_BH24ACT26_07280 [soil metagenome]
MAAQIPASIRDRGTRYFRNGAVQQIHGDPIEVSAVVIGTRPYSVSLIHDNNGFQVSCTCPYFDDGGGACKHIWATLLAAEPRGYLSGPPQAGDPAKAPSLIDLADGSDHWDLEDEDFEDEGFEGADFYDEEESSTGLVSPAPVAYRPNTEGTWSSRLRAIAQSQDGPSPAPKEGFQILYVLDVVNVLSSGHLLLDVSQRSLKRDGTWGKPKTLRITPQRISEMADPDDRQLLSMLMGSQQDRWTGAYRYYSGYGGQRGLPGARIPVSDAIMETLIPLVCRTGRGRLRLSASDEEMPILKWDDGPSWELRLEADGDGRKGHFVINCCLHRGEDRMEIDEPAMLISGGLVFGRDGVVARLDDFGSFGWVSSIRGLGAAKVPVEQSEAFMKQLFSLPRLPRLDFSGALGFEEAMVTPLPRLNVKRASHYRGYGQDQLIAKLSFDYEGELVESDDTRRGVFWAASKRFLLRDPQAEADAASTVLGLGFEADRLGGYTLAPRALPRAVRSLAEAGWFVEAEGSIYRAAGTWHMDVVSGIDWFEVTGGVEFGDKTAAVPELLAAVRRGENFVRLGDGTVGIVPEEWLNRYGMLGRLGTLEGEGLRFKATQLALMDALLASQPEVNYDAAFVRARDKMRSFEGVSEGKEPPGFMGELREYQREGLGWMEFLRDFGFGGCLADDMGLGKTVQVLAMLEARRSPRRSRRGKGKVPPSLIVVPRSLIFNWLQEAERFTPGLRVLDHTGARLAPGDHFKNHDVILTTYGTLRRDAAHMSDFRFDYCILDEAQAIKNASTISAKAARLVKADHRLALSGTPIENHLGELWSLFEFLNPGMLGNASALNFSGNISRSSDASTRAMLAQALRPFILRRTKDQVAKDLPPKTEQTMSCELAPAQRKHYDQLRNHFRSELLRRVDRDGLQKSKIFVLEALLRLRQVACHPGLIDAKKGADSSAKLDLLIPQLIEVTAEGHKALVFSQFTKMLAIVRDRLDRKGITYEYLDGRTRNRKSRVDRFQEDPECPMFLISLKAGGLGLNLTAAEYVFLLDPWWNPAVEAQAIDRTHRIGQERSVFAYRLIARDTVEEKVLQLQESKRTLAESIITTDNSLIRKIQREDLELLLS